MQNKKIKGLESRDNLAKEIIENLQKGLYQTYSFIGKNGSGRKYVMSQIINTDIISTSHRIFYFSVDSFIEIGSRRKTTAATISINIPYYSSISLLLSKDNSNKTNYIINSLKKFFTKQNLIICVNDYERLSAESQDFINVLIENRKYIEAQIKVKICILLVANKQIPFEHCTIYFADYNDSDVKKFINKKYLVRNDDLLDEIYKACGSNLNFVDFCVPRIRKNYFDCLNSDRESIIAQLVEMELTEQCNRVYELYLVCRGTVRDVYIACAMSEENFNCDMIGKICDLPEHIVSSIFNIMIEYKIIVSSGSLTSYRFVSELIRNELRKRSSSNRIYLKFYNYYTEYRNDHYFLRAYYLFKSTQQIDCNVIGLLLLAISNYALYQNYDITEKINSLFGKTPEEVTNLLDSYIQACKYFNTQQYDCAFKKLRTINTYQLNNVGKAELFRFVFQCEYVKQNKKDEKIFKYIGALKRFVLNEELLKLSIDENLFYTSEEYYLKLKIIFDIAPYIMDNLNDVETFEKLYDESRRVSLQANLSQSPFYENIKNIFNRKAFLFVDLFQAESYYEEAESYFFNTENWAQYVMTLTGKSGILLSMSRFEEAIEACKSASRICKDKKLQIKQAYKIDNNRNIAAFLQYEQNNLNNKGVIMSKAKRTIDSLEQLLKQDKVSYVVKMNLASMYLYVGNIDKYLEMKFACEKEMGCADVSDVKDKSVDDFYSYRFSWLQIFYYLICEDYDAAMNVANKLKGVVPSLSHKHNDVLWHKKLDAAKELINNRATVDSVYFCNKLFMDRRPIGQNLKFYYRGLPLSALQFTTL